MHQSEGLRYKKAQIGTFFEEMDSQNETYPAVF
jgi:hypothetical protein